MLILTIKLLLIFVLHKSLTADSFSIINKIRYQNFTSCLNQSGINTTNNLILRNHTSRKYNQLNEQWNLYGGKKYPAGYFIPTSTKDIQSVVICGKSFNISVIPKSGGHGFTKYAYGDSNSIIIDLHQLNLVKVNISSKTAIIGPGARLGHVAYELWRQGRFFTIVGSCPTVGISGFALGGGTGPFSRLYGLSIDNILELEFINSNGQLLIVNKTSHSELFWGLRGAGSSGSFGIVTKFKFKLHKMPKSIIYFKLAYTLSSFPTLLSVWNSNLNKNSFKSIYTYIYSKGSELYLILVDTQTSKAKETTTYGIKRLETITKLFPSPHSITTFNFSYPDYIVYTSNFIKGFTRNKVENFTSLVDLNTVNTSEYGSILLKQKSFYIQGDLEVKQIQNLGDLLLEMIQSGSHTYFLIEAFGGMINNHSKMEETSFIHRTSTALLSVCYRDVDDVQNSTAAINAMKRFFHKSQLILNHSESYQNYVDDQLDNYLVRYYGKNLERLIKLKRNVDPDNYFHNPQSIPLQL